MTTGRMTQHRPKITAFAFDTALLFFYSFTLHRTQVPKVGINLMSSLFSPPYPRILLIGCGKSKLTHAAQARDLYTGPLFRARRAFAEASGCPWFIVSAKYHLLHPETLIEPYDCRLNSQRATNAGWGVTTLGKLADWVRASGFVPDPKFCELEIHAGAHYALGILEAGARFPHDANDFTMMRWPFRDKSMGIGKQLAWYRQNT